MTLVVHPDNLRGNRKQRRAKRQALTRDVEKAQKLVAKKKASNKINVIQWGLTEQAINSAYDRLGLPLPYPVKPLKRAKFCGKCGYEFSIVDRMLILPPLETKPKGSQCPKCGEVSLDWELKE